jgi:hypothetical protein
MSVVSITPEQLDDPISFSVYEPLKYDKRCKDEAGFGCILPNDKHQQNKYAYFYLPKSCKIKDMPKPPFKLDQPVVAFKPLQTNEQTTLKEGATLADLLGLVAYLFRSKDIGFGKGISQNAHDLIIATEMIMGINVNFPILPALEELNTKMKDFVKISEDKTELYLLMQSGRQAYKGFLYGNLLTFVNMLIHKTRQRYAYASIFDVAQKLSIVENVLDKVLGSLKSYQTKIRPPFEAPKSLVKYDSDQHLYPGVALNYMIKTEYLQEDAKNRIGAYWKNETQKPTWVFATIEPLDEKGRMTVNYYKDEAKKKFIGNIVLRNECKAMTEGEVALDLSKFDIIEEPSQVHVTVPLVGRPTAVELVANREPGTRKYRIATSGFDVEFSLTDSCRFERSNMRPVVNKEPPEYKSALLWDKMRIQPNKNRLTITARGNDKVSAQVIGILDRKKTMHSDILCRDLVKVFRFTLFVTSDPDLQRPGIAKLVIDRPEGSTEDVQGLVTIYTFMTQVIETNIPPTNGTSRTVDPEYLAHLYVRSKTGKEAKIFDLYHKFRRFIAEENKVGKNPLNISGVFTGKKWDE